LLAGPQFQSSARLQRFLRFVVDKELEGRSAEICEYTLGVEVFDRGDSFDPSRLLKKPPVETVFAIL